MSSRTQAYLDLALLGLNRWWRYVLGVLLIILTPMVLLLSLAFLAGLLKGAGLLDAALADKLTAVITGSQTDASVLAFVVLNLSIIGMLAGLALAMRWLHHRPLLTLVTPGSSIDWRRILEAAAVGFVILSILTLLESLLFPGRYTFTFDATRFFPFMIAVLLLTPIQAAAEELIFRGYLVQGIGNLTRNVIVLAGASSLLFGAVHLWNPEVERYGLVVMAAAYILSGLLFATVALRDGRLELAIGLHAVNNIFTALIANNESSVLQTSSIFTSPLDPVYALIALFITILVFHWWIFDRSAVKSATVKPVG